jgi:hypothetical protein
MQHNHQIKKKKVEYNIAQNVYDDFAKAWRKKDLLHKLSRKINGKVNQNRPI